MQRAEQPGLAAVLADAPQQPVVARLALRRLQLRRAGLGRRRRAAGVGEGAGREHQSQPQRRQAGPHRPDAQVDVQHAVGLAPVQLAQHVHAQQRQLQRRQRGDAQPVDAHAALQLQVGAHDLAFDRAAGGLRLHAPFHRQLQPLRQRQRQRAARGAGVDQEVHRMAVDRARPVVVAVGGAADLHLLAAAFEARAALLRQEGLHAQEHGQAGQQPHRGHLQPGRQLLHASIGHQRRDALVDGAEHALAVLAQQLDAQAVAEGHVVGAGAAAVDDLARALFGDAAVAGGRIALADRAAADDAAGTQPARAGDVRDQLAEVQAHLGAGVDVGRRCWPFQAMSTGRCTRPPRQAAPSSSGVTATGAKAVAGLLCRKPNCLASSVGHQVAQAPVVGQHQQPHAVQRGVGAGAHGDVAGDHGQLGLEVDAPGGVGKDRVVAGAEQVVAAALVDTRVVHEVGRRLGAARAAEQVDVVGEGRAVGPLVGARQRRHAQLGVEGEGMARLALVQRLVQVFELRRQEVPVVQQLLHARGDAGGEVGAVQVARDDGQLAVARTVLVGGEFHRGFPVGGTIVRCVPCAARRVSPPGPCWRWRCCWRMGCCCTRCGRRRPCWRRWHRAARWWRCA